MNQIPCRVSNSVRPRFACSSVSRSRSGGFVRIDIKIIKRLERFESHLKPSRNSFHLACLLSSNSYALRPCLPSQPFLTPLFGDGPQVHRQGLPVWNSSRLPAAEFCLMAESLRLSGPGDHRCSQHRTAICLLMLCSPLLYHNSHVQTLH